MSVKGILSLPLVYRTGAAAVGAARMRAAYAREYIRARPGQRVLDLGCGPGDMVEYLPECDYEGYDLSAEYIRAARHRFGNRGRFAVADIRELRQRSWTQPFDLVLATGVVHHLDDDSARDLFRVAGAALRPSGRLVTLDGCFRPGQSAVARFLLRRDRGKFVRDEAGYVALAGCCFARVESHIREDLALVPYTYAIIESSSPKEERAPAEAARPIPRST